MNRILLFAALILVSFSQSFGQSKRYIHLEHFTNTRCSSCGSINPGFYNVISGYEGSYHHMTIHPSFPYSSCALYQANISENTARTNFYDKFCIINTRIGKDFSNRNPCKGDWDNVKICNCRNQSHRNQTFGKL